MAVKSTGYAWIVLACGVLASFALFFTVQDRVESVAKVRFESEVRVAGSRIESRIQDYADVLYGVRALFQSMGLVSRRDFHNYVESLNLGPRYPGFQNLNFAQYVTADGKAAFEESVRRDASLNRRGYPEFRVGPPGERPAYYVLTYLEPMEGNEGVFGNDIAMNNYPINLQVLERARDNNELLSSGRLVRIRGADRHVGLAIRLPVYRAGEPIETVEQRRSSYIGSVGAGFRVRESLIPIVATAIPKPIEFTLYNIGPAGIAATPDRLVEDNLLYSNRTAKPGLADSPAPERGAEFSSVQGFQFGGRQLVIHFSASRAAYIDSITQQAGVFALSGGLIITLLLSALVYSLGQSRHEAQLLAAEMTSELQESKGFLDEAQRVARTGSWMLDLTTNEMRWSAETYRIFGVSADTPLIHEAFLQHVHPEDRDAVDRAWQAALKGGRYDIEYRVLVGAAIRWVHEYANLEFAPDETRRRSVGTVQDITERKNAGEQLRAAEEQFRGLVEQAIAGIYIVQDGKLCYVNPRYAEIFGYGSAEEMIGRDILSLVAEKDRGAVAEQMRRRIEGEVKRANYEYAGVRVDGSIVDIGVHGSRATYRGRPAVIGLIQDISEKKRAEEKIKQYVVQLEVSFMQSVEVATALSEMRDPYTAGHERRVAELAVAISAELGFDARRQEGLRVAGYLHDIGKIMIPSEILSKPGKLSPTEFALIKQHPQGSFDVLKAVEFPWPVADVALQHHERIDGSGYPQGLKGDAILLESRILAVADIVEAMSSHRPYRPGLGLDAALAQISEEAGSKLDPQVVDACKCVFRERGFSFGKA